MTIAELHQQLTELCNRGYGGAKVVYYADDVIEGCTLTTCFLESKRPKGQVVVDGYRITDGRAKLLELAHGETFLMLE